jgi:hypothetical protein
LKADKRGHVIKQRNDRWGRAILTFAVVAMLIVAGLVPASSLAYSQRRSAQRTPSNQPSSPYDRSYRQGYDEGYVRGRTDWRSGASRNPQRQGSDQQPNRSNERGRNPSEASAQGYPLGFELGYSDGYFGRARNPVIPANAPAISRSATAADAKRVSDPQAVDDSWKRYPASTPSNNYPPLSVPDDTEMRLRLTSPINTKINHVGDRFTAAITSPARYRGASVEGHIASLNRAGRATERTELALAFDSITLADGEQGPFNADLERILTSEHVKKVDEEGRVEGGRPTRDSAARGVGGIYLEGNNDLILDNGIEMVIRTAGRRQP